MGIRRKVVAKAVAAASVTGLVVVPLIAVSAQLVAGHVHGTEIVIGSLVGTLFFAITGVVTMIYQDTGQLRGAVLGSYVIKTSLLLGLGMQADLDGMNRITLGSVTAASAVAYLLVQTWTITHRNRFKWQLSH